MSMEQWAEEEVRIACEHENPEWDGKSFDYGCSCYQSALKAYKSLCEDGHSGLSFSFTKGILSRLMSDLPLTPIEDEDKNWHEVSWGTDYKFYQSSRMSSLFKYVYSDGTVKYRDNGRSYCQEFRDPNDTFHGDACKIVDEFFPITMPYVPKTEKYKVVVDTFVAEGYEGDATDFNTRAVLYIMTPEKERVEVNRYYAEKDRKFVEIVNSEYQERLKHREK